MSREHPEYGDCISRPGGTFVCRVLNVAHERVVFAGVWQKPDGTFVEADYVSWPLSLWTVRLAEGWMFTSAHESADHLSSVNDDRDIT